MKICVVIFALSLIKTELFAAPSTPRVVSTTKGSSIKGIKETVYFDNSTPLLTLNCSCSNELTQWFANGTICITFIYSTVLYQRNNSLCGNATLRSLTLIAPFSAVQYFCIGTGNGPSCYHRSFLKSVEPSPVFNISNSTLAYKRFIYSPPVHRHPSPLLSLSAFILIILLNFILIEKLASL
ncbi:CR1-alpha [simian adenovirus 11]|uniref:CR1-alpha n=1 Tax=simian adenovirus 11 TaxID=38430 RepID=A0A0M3TH00_9ADEN|nr:CR1-alpha [Simian adenovirus 11]